MVTNKMKGNPLNNGCMKDIEIISNKNTEIFDTSSVFHSSCSTLNISKQDTAYEDSASLMKSVSYKTFKKEKTETYSDTINDMIHQTSHLNEIFEKGLSKVSNISIKNE